MVVLPQYYIRVPQDFFPEQQLKNDMNPSSFLHNEKEKSSESAFLRETARMENNNRNTNADEDS